MAIRYPFLIILIVGAIIACILIFKKKQSTYKQGTKIANTAYIKENAYYQQKLKQYKILSITLKATCLCAIAISSLLLARISKVDEVNNNEYKRDIFLCMDVSGSVIDLNYEIVKNIKDIVKSLNQERFGISIFNTTSVTLVPLTNDYDYILESLNKLEKSFEMYSNSDFDRDDYRELSYYITSGTLEGADKRGGSLIGDGLASCVYDFPNLDEDKDRTRIVILTTDNELAGTPIVKLDEAATIAKQKNVKIFGIATQIIKETDLKAFESAAKKTGGKIFKQSSNSAKEIVKNIEKESKSLVDDESKKYQIDTPTIPFIIILMSMIALIYLDSKVIS